ncbi:MAG: sulfatase-like hydrolase/transferase, partial [Planctomycetes bacterium]|nr:sulfatase-like hydrolase/transferase [Planctomycetota bacterium]
MKRGVGMFRLCVCLFVICCVTSASSGAEKPNIIILMADDLGWNHVGVSGSTCGTAPAMYQTPNVAQLAGEGVSFPFAYAQPNCAPTRAAMLTGQYAPRRYNDIYVVGNLNRNGRGGISKEKAKFKGPPQHEDVGAEAITIAESLKQNGYATAHIGKYHVGGHDGPETLPENSGFDVNIGGFSQGHQPVCFASRDGKQWKFKNLGRGDFDRWAEPYGSAYLKKRDLPESLLGTPKHVSDAFGDAMEETVSSLAAGSQPFYLQLYT